VDLAQPRGETQDPLHPLELIQPFLNDLRLNGVIALHQTRGAGFTRQLLDQLPEHYRRVVVLFYLEDRSCEEVGELLSMPTGTVKALLHRGRKRLAALAGEMENES